MADYYPLIARAIAGLEKNTGEARRALYERARTALVAQLRGIQPPLQESEITRERLALEEAVRKVEAEAARRSRIDSAGAPPPPPAQPPAVPPPAPPGAPRFPPKAAPQAPAAPGPQPRPAAPSPAPGAPRPPAGGLPPAPPPKAPVPPKPGAPRPPGFDAPPAGLPPQAAPPGAPRPPRDPFAEVGASHDFDRLMEPRIAQEDFNREPRGPAGRDDTAQRMDPFRETRGRGQREPDEEEEPAERAKSRSVSGLIKIAVAALLVLALGYVAYTQRGLVTNLFKSSPSQVAKDSKSGAPATKDQQGRPKITDRLGSGQQAGPAVAQRVVLYEEEPNDPQGKRYIGSAIWRTETVSPGPGRPPELAIRADVEIPERRMTMTFSLRRNTDQTLPASHTIEVMFNLPADFAAGGIQNVPGVLMKQAEQTRGTPLAGLAVKVTNNFFLIGLSAVESDQQRNIQLLKERAWFDIPIVYNNNRRAILAIEKGTPGERAFAEAFAAWKQ
jgi:hypothetical protein